MERLAFKNLYLGIFLLPLLVNPFANSIYLSVKLAYLFLFAAGFALIACWFLIDRSKLTIFVNKKIGIFAAFFLLSLLISTIFSVAPWQSLFGDYSGMMGLLTWIVILGNFLIFSQIFRERVILKRFFYFLEIIGLLVAVLAILQFFGIDPFNSVDMEAALNRVYGTLGQPNFLSQFLIFPLYSALFFFWDDRRSRKWIHALVALLTFLAIILAQSKGILLAMFITGCLIFLRNRGRNGLLVALVIFVLMAIVGSFFLDEVRSFGSRIILWKSSFGALDFFSIFGKGLGTSYQFLAEILPKEIFFFEKFFTTPGSPHNEFLEVFIERGLLGVILYLMMIIYLIKVFFRRNLSGIGKLVAAALITFYIANQVSFSTLEHLLMLATFWAILLLEAESWHKLNLKVSKFWIGILVLVSIFCGIFAVNVFYGDILFRKSFSQQETVFVQATNRLAIFAEPQEIFVRLVTEFDTADFLERAGRITGKDYYYWTLKLKNSASLFEAEESYLYAVLRAPAYPIVHSTAVRKFVEMGECELAEIALVKLENLVPEKEKFQNDEAYRTIFQKHATRYFNVKNDFASDCR